MIIEYELKCFAPIFEGNIFFEQRGEILRFVSFKAKINSNEMAGHARPHTHIVYKNIDYICTIDNIIEILEPKNANRVCM